MSNNRPTRVQQRSNNCPTLLIITGPTAVGKTGLAIELAQRLHTSVISADSRQCYQGMVIGTAQPSPEELAMVRHYFVNEFPVTQAVSAADFERLALGYLEEIFAAADTAIACGGTGLYIRALCDGLDDMPAVDAVITAAIASLYKTNGLAWLQDALSKEDPRFAANPEWANPARLLRALGFMRTTGKSILDYRSGVRKARPFRIIKLALALPREDLYSRINTRVDAMMAAGLLEEVKALIPYQHHKALQTVGYAELFDYLDGRCTLQDAVEKIKQHTRNYAKRQLTWLRKEQDVKWLKGDEIDLAGVVMRMVKV